jgi:hypothetical protein
MQQVEDLRSGDSGEGEVEQDDIGMGELQPVHGFAPVHDDLSAVTCNVEHVPEQRGDIAVVFDNEGGRFFHVRVPTMTRGRRPLPAAHRRLLLFSIMIIWRSGN